MGGRDWGTLDRGLGDGTRTVQPGEDWCLTRVRMVKIEGKARATRLIFESFLELTQYNG